MQVFRLVEGGRVDRMIAFDTLPASLLVGIRKRDLSGLPRYWKNFGDFHYFLDYKDVNADKERWQQISNFVRKAVDLQTRLLDKLEEMALPMAPNPHVALELDPEEIPVIHIPLTATVAPTEIITETEAIETLQEETARKKRIGRPKKTLAEA